MSIRIVVEWQGNQDEEQRAKKIQNWIHGTIPFRLVRMMGFTTEIQHAEGH